MIKKSFLFLVLFLFQSLLFSGCAMMHAQNCTENAGYEKGMNDAKMGRLMLLSQFGVFCSGKDVEVAQNGYKKGYEDGKKDIGGAQMNISLSGGKIGLVGAYKCQINYMNQSFSNQAKTEPEARNNVLDQCRKKIPSCPENSIACSKN